MIALCFFGTDGVASFLRDHAVLLALAVSGLWLYAAFDYSRKGNSAGTVGWGAIAVLILFGFCIHELVTLQGSSGHLLPFGGGWNRWRSSTNQEVVAVPRQDSVQAK